MRPNLINRLKEEWNNLDPVDPLRGLLSDAIDALAEQPAQHDIWQMLHDELVADINRSEGRWGLHGHSAVDDDYFAALKYVVKRMDELLKAIEALAALAEQPAQQEQNRQIDQLIQERDHRDEIIDKLCDAVLGLDRYEWSSQYFFEDAVREVEERMAEQPAQPQQKPVTDKENEKFRRDVSNFAGADPEATKYALEEFLKNRTSPPPQRKPLTDEHIDAVRLATGYAAGLERFTAITRAIEAAHGIKENT